MSTKNELIDVINSSRSGGSNVKSIRKQKYDPNNFYMTLTSGKQVGPVKVEGTPDETNRKFNEARSYLDGAQSAPVGEYTRPAQSKPSATPPRATAA